MAKFVPDTGAFYSTDTRFVGFVPITGDSEDSAPATAHGEWDKASLYAARTIYVFNTGSEHFKVKVTVQPILSDTAEGVYVSPDGLTIFDGADSSCQVTDGNYARINIDDVCAQINVSCVSTTPSTPSAFKIIATGRRP